MDLLSLLGLALALAGIIGGLVIEGGHPASLAQLAAFLIVFCGTLGAVMVQTPRPVFARALGMLRWVLFPPRPDLDAVAWRVAGWAQVVRKDGLLALEARIGTAGDPFVKRGLQMLADGFDAAKLRDALESELAGYDERLRVAARVWEGAGGYAPTIGILGAVLGLIQVMEHLNDPARLGPGIAVAFVATVYGVGLANLLFLPISNKLKGLVREQVLEREMLIDGLAGIADGEHPRVIEARLRAWRE